MNSEVKNFIKGIEGLTPAQKDFLNNNRMTFAVTNIKQNADGSVEFESVTDFHLVEQVKLTKSEQKVWDLFNDFNSPKNASNVIMNAIENKKSIGAEDYKQQGKITASEKYNFKNVQTFSQFWALLDDEDKKSAVITAQKWLKDNHIDETSFEFFFVNGTNGVTLKDGDYVMAYDATYGQQLATRVFQASENGLVTCLDDGGYFTLSAGSRPTPTSKEALPKEVVEVLDKTFDKLTEETAEHKEYRFEQAIKRAKKIAEETAKAEAKAEKLAKKEAETKAKAEAKDKAYNELIALKLDSPEAIKTAVEKLNSAGLDKERIAEVRNMVKKAKDDLKAKAEAQKTKAEAPKETKATANAIKPTSEPKTDKPTAKAKDNTKAKAKA